MSDTIDSASQGARQDQADRHQPERSEKTVRTAGQARDDDRPSRDDKADKQQDQKPSKRWPLVILAIVVILAIIGSIIYWLMTRNLESTDDAYTEGNAIAYAAKVSGYVTQLNINDNTVVHTGDLLLKIDQRDYITARDRGRASLSLAKAQLASAQVDLEITRVRAPATLQQAQAQLQQAQANQGQAERDYRRQRAVDPRATTQTNVDQATAQ